jgi:hypothetical protein
MNFIDILQEINKQLSNIAENISAKDYLSDIIPWGLGLISSSVGATIMYIITSKQEKKKFIRDSHIEYMKLTNNFVSEINGIITSIVNIQKMGFILIGDSNNPDLYEPYFYSNLNDYLLIVNKVRALRKTVDSLPIGTSGVYTSKEHYKEQIIILSDDILNFNKIVNICSEYEKEVMNYYYFIDKELRKEHADIINVISKATKENMNGFDIENLKKILVNHIQKTNELILGYKIKEPNYFNKIQENQNIERLD